MAVVLMVGVMVLPVAAKINPPPPTAWFPASGSCPSGKVSAVCCVNTSGGECFQQACIDPWLLGTICLPQ